MQFDGVWRETDNNTRSLPPCAPLGRENEGPFPGVPLRSTPGYLPLPLRGNSFGCGFVAPGNEPT